MSARPADKGRQNASKPKALLVILLLALAMAAAHNIFRPTADEPGKAAESSAEPKIGPAPEFAAMKDVHAKKRAFFDYLLPTILQENRRIKADRSELAAIRERLRTGKALNEKEAAALRRLAELAGMQAPEKPGELFAAALHERWDIVPPSLALAQAAHESGWGSSRFAREGNNYFGLRCNEPGCGIVPRRRPPGATYEVAAYDSPAGSVRDYMENLNRNSAYEKLRVIRARLRSNGEPLSGLALAEGLAGYSEGGDAYVNAIRLTIQSNELERFD